MLGDTPTVSGQRRNLRVFISASLTSLAEQRLNAEIAEMVEGLGGMVYLPQRELPLGTPATPADILRANTSAVIESDVILSVLDKPGLGVAYELGVAVTAKKPVVLFRTDMQDYLGKVLEGLWQSSPSSMRASTLVELRGVLSSVFERR